MEGPAYPIIKRVRIPRGPHRLRDRRWPPVEAPTTPAEQDNSDGSPHCRRQNHGSPLSLDANTEAINAPVAGSAETTILGANTSFWEEQPRLTDSETQKTEPKHDQSTF